MAMLKKYVARVFFWMGHFGTVRSHISVVLNGTQVPLMSPESEFFKPSTSCTKT